MSFDLSRYPFNPWNDYLGVVMQQGRVQLDSDWNEWQAEFNRRIQAGTVDTFGRAAYPASTPFAFKINVSVSGDGLTIGAGRMYVDGLLAENHGVLPSAFTVSAVGGLANPGAYGIQITPGSGVGQFNFGLYQATGGPPILIGAALTNQTLATLPGDVAADATLSQYILIQDAAASGQPLPGSPGVLSMLAPNGADYGVAIPLDSSMTWDPALAELSAAPLIPGAAEVEIDYTQQPYLPGAAAPGAGPYLVYLDVWKREVSFLENPGLVDPAVGVDTTGRLQTVWQVKLLDLGNESPPGSGVTCSTPDADIPDWANLLLPPGGNLSTGVVQSAPDGPCALTPNTGYTGMENQLYRVEIHQAGIPLASSALPVSGPFPAGTATFKWSRDNGSVATAVSAIASVHNASGAAVSQLTVQSLGRDQILGFSAGDWIEITDDCLELNPPPGGPSGELHQIDSVSAPDRTVTLLDSLGDPGLFPLEGGQTDPSRHTRIRRWDQQGKAYLSDGATVYFDAGPAASGGAIPVPPAGTTLILENGVTVTFGLGAVGQFRAGDFWNCAARAADGTVEVLNQAPPQGIHHHYARLAVVTFPATVLDCRIPWPPASGGTCGCTVTIQPSDLVGDKSLQFIVDQYQGNAANVVICLQPGTYPLPSPLRLTAAHSGLTLEACQAGTAVLAAAAGQAGAFSDGMVVLDDVSDVALKGLSFAMPAAPFAPPAFAGLAPGLLDPDVSTVAENLVVSIGVRLVNGTGVAIVDCRFKFENFAKQFPVGTAKGNVYTFGAGIFAGGELSGLQVRGSTFAGVGEFMAGFLLAPSVSFSPASPPASSVPSAPSSFGASTSVGGFVGQAAQNFDLAATTQAQSAAAQPRTRVARSRNAAQTQASAPKSSAAGADSAATDQHLVKDTDLGAVLAEAAAGRFQTIVDAGTSTPTLASAGGEVILSTLDDAVFRENTFTGMTVAVLIIAESDSLEFAANEVREGRAGFWVLSPTQALNLLLDPQNLGVIASAVAMSYPLPAGDESGTVSVPAAPSSVRLYTGAAAYTDSSGNVWSPDASPPAGVAVSGGWLYQPSPAATIDDPNGQADPDEKLYQAERAGNFSYTFSNLAEGYYQITLKFAEIFYTNDATNPSVREFNVSINGQPVLTNLNIASEVGADVVDDKIFRNILPNSQNQIVVEFARGSAGSDPTPKVSAIELDPQWNGVSSLNSAPTGELPSFFVQLAQLAGQGYAASGATPLQLRLADNRMPSLSGPALLVLGDDDLLNANAGSLMMSGNQLGSEISASTQSSDGTSSVFLCTAAVVQVSQCVVSGNALANGGTSAPLFSFCLDASGTAAPGLAVAGNLFDGCISVLPARYPPGSAVPAPMNSWAFLNTVINCQPAYTRFPFLSLTLPKYMVPLKLKI